MSYATKDNIFKIFPPVWGIGSEKNFNFIMYGFKYTKFYYYVAVGYTYCSRYNKNYKIRNNFFFFPFNNFILILNKILIFYVFIILTNFTIFIKKKKFFTFFLDIFWRILIVHTKVNEFKRKEKKTKTKTKK